MNALSEYYLLIKALHIISMVAWMCGMLYLPRLYVYHTRVKPGSEADQLFQTMERKLLRVIINPAMMAALITGILLIIITEPMKQGWFHAKLGLVLVMFASHGILSKYRKDFMRGENAKSEKFFRLINEVPAVLMVAIILLVVLKPF